MGVEVEDGPRRGDVYLVALDPTLGSEIRKLRPCAIVSPDELNAHLSTFTIAPMITGSHAYPFRVPCVFQKKDGYLVLDQLRTVDGRRLVRRLGSLPRSTLSEALAVLREMFAD
ncbi:MAG: type II toxin-antitoxin system PemK/MazF family toxin [Chloroflexi bacterium]|nr:type II toxin-antitoxin system PemK/MazF family toxin [Chloroflexota bacterium]